MSKTTAEWDDRLAVTADAKGLLGHAGAILLRKCADATGLTHALSGAMTRRGFRPGWDRGEVLVQTAVQIALGGTAMSDVALLGHLAPVFDAPASDSTVRRALVECAPGRLGRIASTYGRRSQPDRADSRK